MHQYRTIAILQKTTVLSRGLKSNLEREKLTSDVDRLINYLALSSRPDICFAAYALNSSVENTKEIYGKEAERVPRCSSGVLNEAWI